jgi:hypothetical protein
MSCYKPLIRLYNPDDKEISGRVYSLARFSQLSGKQLKYEDLMYNPKVMLIPCGQCIGCRIRQREDWATRIELEARDYPKEQVWFITLTYDNDHVPGMIVKTGEIMRKVQYTWKPGEKRPDSVQILLYEDIQKFLKRLRKAYRGKLRYFVAGEYGEQTARPHYHMILYGWEPTDLKNLYKIQHNGYYTSEWLANLWGMGQIQIAQAVPETYRYVAGYVTKKNVRNRRKESQRILRVGTNKTLCLHELKAGPRRPLLPRTQSRNLAERIHSMHQRKTSEDSEILRKADGSRKPTKTMENQTEQTKKSQGAESSTARKAGL